MAILLESSPFAPSVVTSMAMNGKDPVHPTHLLSSWIQIAPYKDSSAAGSFFTLVSAAFAGAAGSLFGNAGIGPSASWKA